MTNGRDPRPELVGRDLVREHLAVAAAEARAGRGRLVLLAGEPGIGKSSLAGDLARRSNDDGFLVLWGTGWDGEGTPPFWPWLEALRGCIRAVTPSDVDALATAGGGELGRLLPELFPTGPVAAPSEAAGAQFRLFDAVWALMRSLAQKRPVTLVLDDLQWADVASLDLLRFATARVRSAPVLILGAYRDVEIGSEDPRRAPLAALRGAADVIALSGLDRSAVEQLLASVGGEPVSPESAADVHKRTGGNPFFVREIGRSPERERERGAVPDAVRDVVNRRLARLPRPCFEVLRVAAVVGQESDAALLAEVLDTPEATILDRLQEAERGGIVAPSARGVRGILFVHDLFRETLYDGGQGATMAELHSRIGRTLEERRARGVDVAASELAHHFLRASPDRPDRARAVRYSLEAAQDAINVLAPHQALGHARRALAALDSLAHPDESERLDVLLVLGDAERRAGEGAHARLTVERAATLARRLGASEALARAALLAQLLGEDYGTGGAATRVLLRDAEDALGHHPGGLRARVLGALARHLYHHDRTKAPEARELAATAVKVAESSSDAAALAFALFAQHDTAWEPGTALQRLEIARRMETVASAVDPELRAEAVLLAAIARLELCDGGAAAELERYCRLSSSLRDQRFQYKALTRQITIATMQGDLHAAESLLQQASLLGEAIGEPDQWHVEMRELWVLRTLQGRQAELEDRVRSWPYPVYTAWYSAQVVLSVCARRSAADTGMAAARLADFDPAAEPLNNLWLVQAATVAEAAVATGDRVLAARLYDALLPYAGLGVVTAGAVDFYGAVDHYLGLLATCLECSGPAVEHLELAVAQHRKVGAAPWVTRSQQALADATRAAASAARPTTVPPVRRGVFRQEGEWWVIGLGSRETRVADAKGLHDIRTRITSPGRTVGAADLLAGIAGPEASGEAAFGGDEVLDERARSAYRARLTELDEELNEAEAANDVDRVARTRFERQVLVDELAAALGLGGRARLLGSGAERARKAVTARIRNSLRRMARVHPELADHLGASITTGTACSYMPAEPVSWET